MYFTVMKTVRYRAHDITTSDRDGRGQYPLPVPSAPLANRNATGWHTVAVKHLHMAQRPM